LGNKRKDRQAGLRDPMKIIRRRVKNRRSLSSGENLRMFWEAKAKSIARRRTKSKLTPMACVGKNRPTVQPEAKGTRSVSRQLPKLGPDGRLGRFRPLLFLRLISFVKDLRLG